MAVITSIGTGDMRCVLAGRNRAIVAGTAGTDHLGVIDRGRWSPQYVAVAIFADVRGLDMRHMFAGGGGAVVAANTVAHDTGVIEAGR